MLLTMSFSERELSSMGFTPLASLLIHSVATFNFFLSIPCLLFASAISLVTSCSQIGFFSKDRRVINGSILPKGFFVTYGAILIVLSVAFVLEIFLTPVILNKLL